MIAAGGGLAADPILGVLVLLGGGLLAMAVSARTGLNFLLALILAGAALGPSALGLVTHGRGIELLAELGVAFLLFDIGLHLSARSLWDARRYLFAFAPAQIAGSALALMLLLALAPEVGAQWWLAAALALSSTAVVLQLLRDAGEEQSPIGRAALAALLAQDLFVVLLLVLLPALASGGPALGALAAALLRLALAVAACVGIGRLVMAPLLGWIARTDRPEAFTAAALFFVLGVGWLTHAFGLSLALGAFLAGVALAESRYAHLVQSEVAPFRGLLLALFFLSVGMAIELAEILARPLFVLALAAGLVALKTLATLVAARAVGKGWGSALRLGLLLSQGSEFVFVVLGVAAGQGLVDAATRAPVEAAVVLSIAATPALAALGRRLAAGLEADAAACPDAIPRSRVVLLGFDPTMRSLARALDRAAVPFVAFTSDRERAVEARSLGFEAHYADPGQPRGLALAERGGAAALVIGVDDDAHGVRLAEQARAIGAAFPVYAVTGDERAAAALRGLGVAQVVGREESGARQLAATILAGLGLSGADVAEGVAECGQRHDQLVGGAVAVN